MKKWRYKRESANVKFTNKNGIELPNIEATCGTEFSDAYDDVEYDRDYVPPQTTTDIELQADDEIEEDELDEIIEDERRHNDRSDVRRENDESEDDEETESKDDDSQGEESKSEISESDPESDESSIETNESCNVEVEEDDIINRRIDDVINEFEKTVLPGAEEVMDGHVQEIRRSGRTRQEVERLTYLQTQHLEPEHNIFVQDVSKEKLTYSTEAMVLATYMDEIDYLMKDKNCISQQHLLEKGLKIFGEKGYDAIMKEMGQLDDREAFRPIHVSELTTNERRKAQIALAYLTEKRDGTIKGRTVYNGKPTRELLSKEDSASPTASLDSILLTAMIDAHEGRDVMTTDVPNVFIQTPMEQKEEQDRTIMKVTGSLVDILVQKNPLKYKGYVVFENGKKVMYLEVLRAIYGMLESALLWYRKFRSDLEENGYIFNNYDLCVANKTIRGNQMTVRFHVDDCMSSHVEKKANDELLEWLNDMYGKHGEVKAVRGTVHDYLGMTF